jgi:hypothetical protein
MRRDQLEHAIRAACQIAGLTEVIIVGSQAILGTYTEDELPFYATRSSECAFKATADRRVAATGARSMPWMHTR